MSKEKSLIAELPNLFCGSGFSSTGMIRPVLRRLGSKMRTRVSVLAAVALVGAGLWASGAGPAVAAEYKAPRCKLAAPTASAPAQCSWQGTTLNSPLDDSQVAGPNLGDPCQPTRGDCEDIKVVVPEGVTPSTLYVRVAWQHPVWSAFLYVIDPEGNLHGRGGLGCDTSRYEKGCGNQTTLPLAERVVEQPALEQITDNRHDHRHQRQRDQRRHAQRLGQHQREIGRQHDEVAMGEVHHTHDAEGEREAAGEQRVEPAQQRTLQYDVDPLHRQFPK